jgi:hypothetical protein
VTSSTGSEPSGSPASSQAHGAGDLARLLQAYDAPRPPRADRPWVLCNLVATLDGHTAVYGRVGMLSTPADQTLFHHLRSLAGAILVGAATVRRGATDRRDHRRDACGSAGRWPDRLRGCAS